MIIDAFGAGAPLLAAPVLPPVAAHAAAPAAAAKHAAATLASVDRGPL